MSAPRLEVYDSNGAREVPSLYVWRITVQSLEVGKLGEKSSYYIGHRSLCSFREVAADARAHYSEEWWKTFLMVDIALVGPLRRIDGVSLVEDD